MAERTKDFPNKEGLTSLHQQTPLVPGAGEHQRHQHHSDTPMTAFHHFTAKDKGRPFSLVDTPQSNSWPDPIANMPAEGGPPPVEREFQEEDSRRLKEEMHIDVGQVMEKQRHNEEAIEQRHKDLEQHIPPGGIFSAAAGVTEPERHAKHESRPAATTDTQTLAGEEMLHEVRVGRRVLH